MAYQVSLDDIMNKIEELREATRLANEVLKDVETLVHEAVTAELKQLGEATEKAMKESTDRVFAQFDKLAAALMGTNNDGRPSLIELAKLRQDWYRG